MKLRPELGIVQETLLLPLIGRAEISKKHPNFFTDKKAESIFEQLDFDKHKARKSMQESGLLAMAVRALKMDDAIRKFVYQYPKATILNVGAGLDTAFWRVDNGQIKWIDLDLPDSIALREKVLPESDRNTHLAKSIFDYSWINDIGDVSQGLFIQIPGVLPYIEPNIVRDFFDKVPQQLPNAEVIFDVVSDLGKVFITQGIRRSGMKKANLKWGISDAKTLEKWSPHIEVYSQERFFENIQRKWSYNIITNLAMNVNDLMSFGQIFHLRFK